MGQQLPGEGKIEWTLTEKDFLSTRKVPNREDFSDPEGPADSAFMMLERSYN